MTSTFPALARVWKSWTTISTLSSSDKNNTKNVSFEFSGSKDFPSKNPPSKLTYTLIPKQSHIDVS